VEEGQHIDNPEEKSDEHKPDKDPFVGGKGEAPVPITPGPPLAAEDEGKDGAPNN